LRKKLEGKALAEMKSRYSKLLVCGAVLFLMEASLPFAFAEEGGAAKTSDKNPDLPLQVESSEKDGWVSAEVSGSVDIPYEELKGVLSDPSNWCDFVPLTLNIKACTCRKTPEGTQLTFFAGRKFYQEPEDVYELNYAFSLDEPKKDVLQVLLTAEKGPVGTEDYRIEVLVFPGEEGTLIHFSSSYQTSLMSRLLRGGYLATAGRDKVGFTITGRNSSGDPVYVQGVRGIIERNVMRYYLALKAYLKTRDLPPETQFESAIQKWFDMTEKYSRQLYEVPREEYLDAKRKERRNQSELQREIGSCRTE